MERGGRGQLIDSAECWRLEERGMRRGGKGKGGRGGNPSLWRGAGGVHWHGGGETTLGGGGGGAYGQHVWTDGWMDGDVGRVDEDVAAER